MIAIICAMESEITFYKTILENMIIEKNNNIEFFIGNINNKKIILTKCGIGKVNSAVVTSILVNEFNPKLIINTGIAGGISPLETSDIFVATEFVYGDFDLQVFNYLKGQVPGFEQKFVSNKDYVTSFTNHLQSMNIIYKQGLIVTQDSFITSLNQIEDFDGIIATDMEGASIAHTCKILNVNFLSIRIISDIIGSKNQVLNYNEFEIESAKLSSKITYEFIKNLI